MSDPAPTMEAEIDYRRAVQRFFVSVADNRPKIYLALMIGPDMSGKTTFSSLAKGFFQQNYPDFTMELLHYDLCSHGHTIYQLKNFVIKTMEMNRNEKPDHKTLIVLDARNLHDYRKRFNIFLFCLKFDIIYLQIYMEFNPSEVLARCARKGLFLNPKVLKNPEYFNTTNIGCDPNSQWENNSITIFKSFKKKWATQAMRLYKFLMNCIPPEKDSPWISYMPKVPLEYDNPHKLQMRAGISYKDKLLHGKVPSPDKKNGVQKENGNMSKYSSRF